MTLLTVNNLQKYHGANLIFSGLGFQISRGEKVALVGANGAGKSTLMRMLAGHSDPDGGTISYATGNRVAYLAQEVTFPAGRTLWQEMEHAAEHLLHLRRELRRLETLIADTTAPDWAAHMQHYGELSDQFERGGGYDLDRRIEQILQGLRFTPDRYDQPLDQFSGGQKTRAALAAALLADPDMLLLDEPTNHLDIETLEWLEGFLRDWQGTLLVISHDRYFLEQTTRRTLDIEYGALEDYPASYDRYLALKAERLEQRLKQYAAQQAEIARTEAFIQRYGAGQRAKEARGREKRLNRLKAEGLHERPQDRQELRLLLDSKLRSGDMVLRLADLTVGYHDPGGRTVRLFGSGEKELYRGERVALLGANGCGKTSLLRTLLGNQPALDGAFYLGHNVQLGYFAQGHDTLPFDLTILDAIRAASTRMDEERARTILGSFLFTGDDVFKRIGDLSGGERSRVAMARLMLQPANLLILDEPTNHLDIASCDVLEAALKEYPGSLLFVSHDRHFIDALADKLWVVEHGTLTEELGSYRDLQARRTATTQRAAAPPASNSKQTTASKPASNSKQTTATKPAPPKGAAAEERKRQKQVAQLEKQVEQLEDELARISSAIDAASQQQDIERVTALGAQYRTVKAQLDECYHRWAELAA